MTQTTDLKLGYLKLYRSLVQKKFIKLRVQFNGQNLQQFDQEKNEVSFQMGMKLLDLAIKTSDALDQMEFCPPTLQEILLTNEKNYKLLGSVCILFLAYRILSLGPTKYDDKVKEVIGKVQL